jgi:hypothetical protein
MGCATSPGPPGAGPNSRSQPALVMLLGRHTLNATLNASRIRARSETPSDQLAAVVYADSLVFSHVRT